MRKSAASAILLTLMFGCAAPAPTPMPTPIEPSEDVLTFDCPECYAFNSGLADQLELAYEERWPETSVFPTAYSMDLNGDGLDEFIVQIISYYWCGTGGCSTWILQFDGISSWVIAIDQEEVADGVIVFQSMTNGYRDIGLYSGSIDCYARYAWDGGQYSYQSEQCREIGPQGEVLPVSFWQECVAVGECVGRL